LPIGTEVSEKLSGTREAGNQLFLEDKREREFGDDRRFGEER